MGPALNKPIPAEAGSTGGQNVLPSVAVPSVGLHSAHTALSPPPFPGVNIINAQMKPKDVLPITPQRAPNCLPGACGRQERTQQHLQEPLGVYSFIFPKIHLRGPQSLCKIHKTHELGRFPPFHHPSVPPGNTIKMTSPPGPRSS